MRVFDIITSHLVTDKTMIFIRCHGRLLAEGRCYNAAIRVYDDYVVSDYFFSSVGGSECLFILLNDELQVENNNIMTLRLTKFEVLDIRLALTPLSLANESGAISGRKWADLRNKIVMQYRKQD